MPTLDLKNEPSCEHSHFTLNAVFKAIVCWNRAMKKLLIQ